MIEYKPKWTAELERRQWHGVIAREPIPHPDDIFINIRRGNIEIEGPMDEKQKKFWVGMRSFKKLELGTSMEQ